MQESEYTVIAQFSQIAYAEMLVELLGNEGIEAFIETESDATLHTIFGDSPGIGIYEVVVGTPDALRAIQLTEILETASGNLIARGQQPDDDFWDMVIEVDVGLTAEAVVEVLQENDIPARAQRIDKGSGNTSYAIMVPRQRLDEAKEFLRKVQNDPDHLSGWQT